MLEPGHQLSHRRCQIYGRDTELDQLRLYLSDAIAGRGSLVLISGDAGIGKTTLVEALTREARSSGARVLIGGCYDLTATPPYGPWLEVGQDYGLSTNLPPLPRELKSEPSPPAARSQVQFFRDVMSFLKEVTADCPLVIILEDLHWSDQASLELLRFVARQVSNLPLLLVVTYRSDETDNRSPLYQVLPILVRETRAERLQVHPLGHLPVAELVSREYPTSGADQARLVDYLERHAEGNPFYILELIHGLEDQRLLTFTGDSWRLGDLRHVPIPSLLQQMIEMRLSRLSDVEQKRLFVAAVIGQAGSIPLWAAALEVPQAELVDTIERAVKAQLVAVSSVDTFHFRHALIREGLYQLILPPRRRILHQTLGELLERDPGVDPDIVAWHFQQAGDKRVAPWLIRASERAQRSYAWTTAAERLVAAVELLAADLSDLESGWLVYRIGRLRRHANVTEAIRWLREAVRLGILADDSVLVAYSRFDLGHLQVLAGSYQQGLQEMRDGDALLSLLPSDHVSPGEAVSAWVADSLPEQSTPIVREQPSRPMTAAMNPRRGTLVQWLAEPGRYLEARELGESYVAETSEPVVDDRVISSFGDTWFGLGRVYSALGKPAKARQALETALGYYERIDHHLLVSSTLRVLLSEVALPYETANIEGRQALARRAQESFSRATGVLPSELPPQYVSLELLLLEGVWSDALAVLEVMEERTVALHSWYERSAALSARLARDRGEVQQAWKHIHNVLPTGVQTAPGTASFVWAIELQNIAVDLALDAGELESARSWLEALEGWLQWSQSVRWNAEVQLLRARYCLAVGDEVAARDYASEALRSAGSPRQPLALLAAHRFLGCRDLHERRYREGEQHLLTAFTLADACGAPFEVALTQLALAEFRIVTGDSTAARSLIAVARSTLEPLGARPALDHADRLASQLAATADGRSYPFGLSAREVQVLRLVSQGMTDAQVADHLSISYRTVTTHLTSIFNKLGVSSRVAATRIAIEQKIA
jgi:DNA-binding CsgD family transcriptional regulator